MRELTCIVCPNGCELKFLDDGSVVGNLCQRGEAFAKQEVSHPLRSVTATCKTIFEDIPVVAVKSDAQVEKDMVWKIIEEIKKTIITKKLGIGDVVIENVLDSKVNIIMCTNELKER